MGRWRGEVPKQRQDGRLHLSILLLSRDMAEKKIKANGIEDGVLGQAHTSGGRASIFCDRIAATPGALPHFAIPIGDIIAHEAGHLLLGANSHSRSGIMRANVDVRALQLQSFDKAQAHTIRTTLMAVTAESPPMGGSNALSSNRDIGMKGTESPPIHGLSVPPSTKRLRDSSVGMRHCS